LCYSSARYTLATKSTIAKTGDKSATKSTVADTVNFVVDTVDFVFGFGDKSATTWIRKLVAVDIVANFCCRYSRLCRQCVPGFNV